MAHLRKTAQGNRQQYRNRPKWVQELNVRLRNNFKPLWGKCHWDKCLTIWKEKEWIPHTVHL